MGTRYSTNQDYGRNEPKIQHEPPHRKTSGGRKKKKKPTAQQPSKPRNSFGTYWDMSPFSRVSQTFVTWIESPPAIFLTELLFVLKISIRKMTVRDFEVVQYCTVRVDSVQSNERASKQTARTTNNGRCFLHASNFKLFSHHSSSLFSSIILLPRSTPSLEETITVHM